MSSPYAPFTQRLVGFKSRLVLDKTKTFLAVKDQLLFSQSASPFPLTKGQQVTKLGSSILAYLKSQGTQPRFLTSVFQGLPNEGHFEDVAIVRVVPPTNQTVFDLTGALRKKFLPGARMSNASPNHVLIPAPNSLWCPFGPPAPVTAAPVPHPVGTAAVEITVIDTGYMWAPPTPGPPWGPNGSPNDNPLHGLCTSFDVTEADWLDLTGPIPHWRSGTPNIPDANNDHKLDALAGHANFVAGVVAQQVELPTIHIWNHNSAFLYAPTSFDNFSTEAAICRSLVMSQQGRPSLTPVIQIGHETAVYENVPSDVWALAFSRIGYKRNLANEIVITCPAGNEGLLPSPQPTIPRYPAALHAKFPFVKGVASISPAIAPSPWSNHGSWVTCSAIGEDVVSTFLYVNMPVEEDTSTTSTGGPPSRDFTPNSWAVWNGTSFAAPKVAGAVAARLSPTVNAGMAWTTLLSVCGPSGCATIPGFGTILPI